MQQFSNNKILASFEIVGKITRNTEVQRVDFNWSRSVGLAQ
jgi:hypothetical protein